MVFRPKDVPLDRDSSGRFLPWLVAVMVYLGALALVSAMAMNKVAERWDRGLEGRLTVQLPPPALDEGPERQAEQAAAVVELLQGQAGIASAEDLSPDAVADLLRPWLGDTATSEDLPLPGLIAVVLEPGADVDPEALSQRLQEIAPGAVVDDHQRWVGHLLALARSIELIALLIVFLVDLSAVIMVIFVTRMGLAVHRQVIELLHLIGARDSYIARQFQMHAMRLGVQGGVIGLVLALLTVFGVGRLLARMDAALLPDLSLRIYEWALLLSLPLAAAIITMITARLTVLRTLTKLP